MLGATQNSTVTFADDYVLPGGQKTCTVPWDAWERTDADGHAWSCSDSAELFPEKHAKGKAALSALFPDQDWAIWCQFDDFDGEQMCAVVSVSEKASSSAVCQRVGTNLRCRHEYENDDLVGGHWKPAGDGTTDPRPTPAGRPPDYAEEIRQEALRPCAAAAVTADGKILNLMSMEEAVSMVVPDMERKMEKHHKNLINILELFPSREERNGLYATLRRACIDSLDGGLKKVP